MSFERPSSGIGPGAEAPPTSTGGTEGADLPGLTPAMRLQILSTEHWSLLASRSLAWNETFSRAGMFLSTLSGAIVALALVAQAADFGPEFVWFALLILPVVLFVGIATFVRQGGSNYHDAFCVVGMNRIRAAYLELAPDLERYFVTSAHDDVVGLSISMGTPAASSAGSLEVLGGTPTMVAILNGVLAGVIVALVLVQLGVATGIAVGGGIVGFLVFTALEMAYAARSIARAMAAFEPRFPGSARD